LLRRKRKTDGANNTTILVIKVAKKQKKQRRRAKHTFVFLRLFTGSNYEHEHKTENVFVSSRLVSLLLNRKISWKNVIHAAMRHIDRATPLDIYLVPSFFESSRLKSAAPLEIPFVCCCCAIRCSAGYSSARNLSVSPCSCSF
jgi:hypothetical protein